MPDIKISSLEGHDIDAYCAMPSAGLGPGLIVIHDNYGVDDRMRKICDDYAAQGYIAICPNLFWRQADTQLSGQVPKGFDVEAGFCDLLSTLCSLRKMTECSGKVGALGYSSGGLLAYLLAARSDIDSSVCYYGTGLDTYLDELRDIRTPLLLHFAERDECTPSEIHTKIISIAEKNPAVTAQVYQGVGQAFARLGDKNYNKGAAELVNSRTSRFLAETLLN